MYSTDKGTKGFTLIEMSIVLVIIGLITGGILVGQSLIRQSQINSAMTDAQRYISAAVSFQQKYNALPGDMGNATTYWGSMSTCPSTPGSASQGGTLTCNGDGNGQVNNPLVGTYVSLNEQFLFWQHLANAQLIPGNYTGIAGSAGYGEYVIGTNAPAGRLPGLGFAIVYGPSEGYIYAGHQTATPTAASVHELVMGGYFRVGCLPVGPILTTQEAQSFDSKYDDGMPASGNVQVWIGSYSANCAVQISGATKYTYNVANIYYSSSSFAPNGIVSGNQCTPVILTGF